MSEIGGSSESCSSVGKAKDLGSMPGEVNGVGIYGEVTMSQQAADRWGFCISRTKDLNPGLEEVHFYSTTGGQHTSNCHPFGYSGDLSRINGMKMSGYFEIWGQACKIAMYCLT
jgi:hypothetical protein